MGVTMSLNETRMLRRSALALALSSALLLGGTASAQEQQDEESAQATTLDSVQVTARKRSESIIEVPMNITAISAQELEDRNIGTVSDLYRTLAGAASPTGGLILRGLSGGNSASPGTTSQFVDGIPFGFGNVFDVEQIEVLRGPQGTLWGSNAIGGTVQVVTRKPQVDNFEVFASLSGTLEENNPSTATRTQAGINVPLVQDSLALRIAASTAKTPGKIVNVKTGNYGDEQDDFIRTQLQWEATPDLRLNVGHVYVRGNDTGTRLADASVAGFYYVPELTPNAAAPTGFDIDYSVVDCPDGASRAQCRAPNSRVKIEDDRFAIYEAFDGWSRSATNLFSVNVEHDDLFGIASVSYIGSFRKNTGSSLDNWTRLDMEDMTETWMINQDSSRRLTQELRFQNLENDSGLNWTVGFFQDKTWLGSEFNGQNQFHNTDPQSLTIFSDMAGLTGSSYWGSAGWTHIGELGQALYGNPGINYNLTYNTNTQRESAAFGETSYRFDTGVGAFEVTAGIRFYELEDTLDFTSTGIWVGLQPRSVAEGGRESGNRKKFSLAYLPSDNLNIYALYAEGYRPGGNNAPLANSCANDEYASQHKNRYTSDTIDNYELGVKGAFFDRRLRISSAAYRIDWSDVRASVYMPTCGFSFIANAAEARSQGLELESSLQLGTSTVLTFNASYTNTEILTDVAALGARKGDEFPQVPKYNAYLAVDHGFRLFDRDAFVRADIAAYGEYKTHFNVRDEDVSPSYETLNLSGRVRLNPESTLSLHVNNVTNEQYYAYRNARSRGVNTRNALYELWGAERSITLRFDYSFR